MHQACLSLLILIILQQAGEGDETADSQGDQN